MKGEGESGRGGGEGKSKKRGGRDELTQREKQKTQMDRKTATSRIAPKMMKSCSNLAKESSQITTSKPNEALDKA